MPRGIRAATRVCRHGLPAAVRRHPLAAFFLLAYAFSWGYWLPVALTGGHLSHFPGLLGPMLSALLVTAIVQGWAGLRDLLSRLGRWRVPLRWYGAAVVPVVAGLLTLGGLWLAGHHLPSLTQLSTMPGLPAVGWVGVMLLALVVNGYGEETGWRGLAWPQLRKRHGLGSAALLLAIPWAVWHLPTFWLDTGMRGFSLLLLPGFFVGMAAGAVVLGWLYERARCSVLIVALFHALLNMASATTGTEGLVAATVSTVVIVWAIAILRAEAGRGDHQERGPSGRHVSRRGLQSEVQQDIGLLSARTLFTSVLPGLAWQLVPLAWLGLAVVDGNARTRTMATGRRRP